MRTILKNFVLAFIISFAVNQQADSQNFNPNLAAVLQQTLDAQVAAFPVTKGASVSVYYPGQGIWTGASGLSYAGHPITTDMEFGIASNSKLFTAVAVMKLVESNTLNLNDQLKKWLPTYKNIDSSITIRQLLNHRSGIADVFNAASMTYIDANPTHVFTTAEVMAYVGPKLFKAGTSYSYSNTNYILAGMIVESATGQAISKIIRDSILTPLHLDSTFYDGKETVLGTIAHPWHNGIDGINISRNALNSLGTSAGSMYSTAGEMAKWYQALMSGQVVSASSLNDITTFVSTGNYGFGIMITQLPAQLSGRIVWGHGGSNIGYTSRMMYDPEMKAVVCGLANSNPSAITGAITGILYKTLVDYLPASAGVISGLTTVCQGQNQVTYTVPIIAKANSYIWTLPNGVSGVSSTNSITVNYGASALSGNITVVGANIYGNGVPSKLQVTVNQVPNVIISGAKEVVVQAIKQYSIQQITGAITWSISGGLITAGQGTPQVTVKWGGAGIGSIASSVLLPSGCITFNSMNITKYEAAKGQNLALWFDAGQILGANNGQQLPFTAPFNESHPCWQDISGNNRGAYMFGGNQILIPTFYDNGQNTVNGIPAVAFDQINDALIVNNSTPVNSGLTKTLFSVFKTGADVTANQIIFETGSGAATHSGFNIYIHKADIGFGVWNGNKSVWIHKACVPNTAYLTQLVYDGNAGTLKVSVNNSTKTATGAPDALPQGTQFNGLGSSVQGTRLRTGYTTATIDYPFGGSIAEVLLYNTVSTEIRSQTFSYLNAKYGFSFGENLLLKSNNSETSDNSFEVFQSGLDINVSEDSKTSSVKDTQIEVQSNPVQDFAKIRIQTAQTEEVEISLYNSLGQLFMIPVMGLARVGWNEFTIPTQHLSTGMYRIVVSGTTILERAPLFILK